MSHPLSRRMESAPVILDGGLATELERRGLSLEDELWSSRALIDAPSVISDVHAAYLRAGADVITSATYQATFQGFARAGVGPASARALLLRAVDIARQARDVFWSEPANRRGRTRPLVAASIGSYGAFLADGSEYRGGYGLSMADLVDFHRDRLKVLATSGADVLALETIPCRAEAIALCSLVSAYPEVGAWLAFSCRDGALIASGEPFDACAEEASRSDGILAVGVNCTSPVFIEPLLLSAWRTTPKPLVAYPNSGEIWEPGARQWRSVGEARPLSGAALWVAAGARLVGGCCRTTPEDITVLRRTIRQAPGSGGGEGDEAS